MKFRNGESSTQCDRIPPLRDRIWTSSLQDLTACTVVEALGTEGIFHKQVVVKCNDAGQLTPTLRDEICCRPDPRSVPFSILVNHQDVSSDPTSMPLLPDIGFGQPSHYVPNDILLTANILA